MGLTSNFNPALAKKVLVDYRNGLSPAKICYQYGLSEKNYRTILEKYSPAFKRVRRIREMHQAKARELMKKNRFKGNKVKSDGQRSKKMTAEEKIKHLQRQLENERKKNQELETILEVAKEHLGKF